MCHHCGSVVGGPVVKSVRTKNVVLLLATIIDLLFAGLCLPVVVGVN